MSSNNLTKEYILSQYANGGQFIVNDEQRAAACEQIKTLEFPTLRDEAWRGTNLRSLFENSFQLNHTTSEPTADNISDYLLDGLDANVLVFIDGDFSEKHSQVLENDKIHIKNIREAQNTNKETLDKYLGQIAESKQNIFDSINTVFSTEGVFVHVPAGKIVEKPVYILSLSGNNADKNFINNRNLIVVEDNAQAKIIEAYYKNGQETSLNNTSTEVYVGKNAIVDYHILQYESQQAFQINRLSVKQESNSTFHCYTITFDGTIVRNELKIDLAGEHCENNINGLYFADNGQHFDNYTQINHLEPYCASNENYRGIIGDKGSSVFFGKIFVAKDAQRTDANQSNKNILLSQNAKVSSKPQLEIYADDVSCSHGSTTGQLDEDAIFYMRARGLSKSKARALMLIAYAAEVFDGIKIESLKNKLINDISTRLENE